MNGTGDIESDKKHIDNSKIDSQTEKIDQSPVLGLLDSPVVEGGWKVLALISSLVYRISSL